MSNEYLFYLFICILLIPLVVRLCSKAFFRSKSEYLDNLKQKREGDKHE